jgi:hypothetical protein
MVDITTKSGVAAKINPADFKHAHGLKNAVEKALLKQNIQVGEIDFSKLSRDSVNLGLNAALAIDSDEEVYKYLFLCFSRCLYNGQKITEETFEDVGARKDYYELIYYCMKENLAPFFAALFSKLKDLGLKMTPDLNQKPQSAPTN